MSVDEAVVVAVRQLRAKIEQLERARHEGLAIVGIGCRLPGGVSSPDELWAALRDGVDTVTEVPSRRWDANAFYDPDPMAAGRISATRGAFVDGVDEFDPYFFGISPREAERMDPQQRLFLEVSWDALEQAGLTREALRGSPTGVFVGANSTDYLDLQLLEPAGIDTYTSPGGVNSVIANRLSYLFDLRGPSMTVDTACSSSLVAVHLAARALRDGECDVAVVGGTSLMLSPYTMMTFDKLAALAPDGRCKTFDARADGYGRGEGVLAIVLKRLSDAEAAGDRIWAVVNGSAVNQDGLTNGLTAPNGVAQADVIRRALADARVTADRVSLIEAHGTGTALGDPIEVEALAETYGGADAGPCAVGSVKTNIGHLEAAAGLAGLVKAALCIDHEQLVPSLNLRNLNPHITIEGTRLFVPTEVAPWTGPADRRHAAVSAFGAGGTNAHVVLGPAPERPPAAVRATDRGLVPLVFSARSAEALAPMATAYRDWLRSPEAGGYPFREVAAAAVHRRSRHEHRCLVVAGDHAEAADRLDRWLTDSDDHDVVTAGQGPEPDRGIVFVFAGHGAQRLGMGRELRDRCPVFRRVLRDCDDALRAELGYSVVDRIHATDVDALPDDLEVIQPALFAVAVALAARWRSLGVEPGVVVGHSMGEVAAAHVAGALDLADAAKLITVRSRALARLAGSGELLVVGLSREAADDLVESVTGAIWVAVSNSPTSTVLSGDLAVLTRVADDLRERGVFCRRVSSSVAGHGPAVEVLREEMLTELAGLRPRAAEVPFVSTVTGERCAGTELDAAYWYRNLREPVLFWDAARSLVAKRNGVFIELSPHPLLLGAVEQALERADRPGLALPSMRRDEPEARATLTGIGTLFLHDLVDLPESVVPATARAVPLPRYPWQRERFWFRSTDGPITAPGATEAAAPEPVAPAAPVPVVDHAPATPAEMVDLVLDAVATVLRCPPHRIDVRAGFFQQGMDSLLALRVRRRLEAVLGRSLPTALLFEHPTVADLGAHLAGQEPGEPATTPPMSDVDELGLQADQLDGLAEADLIDILAAEIHASADPTETTR